MTAEAAGIYLDYSMRRITVGQQVNVMKRRTVLHIALHAPDGQSIVVDVDDVGLQVHVVLDKMAAFASRVRSSGCV
jgi:glucose-6-phosphate isomerase